MSLRPGAASGDGAGGGPAIVVTTAQAADMVRNVAGSSADVTQILPANADPHEYEPTPSDAEALADADLIVRSGGDVDELARPADRELRERRARADPRATTSD